MRNRVIPVIRKENGGFLSSLKKNQVSLDDFMAKDDFLGRNQSKGFRKSINEKRDSLRENEDSLAYFYIRRYCYQKSFEQWNVKPPLVMTSINPVGYEMNPSKASVKEAIKKYRGEIIAMTTRGSRPFSMDEVNDYMISVDELKFYVVGASSEKHLQELKEVFRG